MYFGNDSDGNIIMSDLSDILDSGYQELFPENASELIPDYESSSEDLLDYESSSEDFQDSFLTPEESSYITYDNLVDLLANIPGYNVYPNTSAVTVFDGVFRNFGLSGDYVLLSGPDTSSTYFYWSKESEVSGNNITLKDPVYFCNYSTVRSGTVTNYNYTVSVIGDTSFSLSNQLAYTNLLLGYPSLPSDQRGVGHSISSVYILPVTIVISFIIISIFIRRRDA